MSAVIAILFAAFWLALGIVLWRLATGSIVPRSGRALLAGILLGSLWMIAPLADELLGSLTFGRLCREVSPTVHFFGPVNVGPGVFFDESGNRRWKSEDEFFRIKRSTDAWEKLFGSRKNRIKLRDWPIEIWHVQQITYDRATGQSVIEMDYLGSTGGWIKRVTGFGAHAPYECLAKGRYPKDDALIRFQARPAHSLDAK